MKISILEAGVTHPTIHLDYYNWLSNMTEFEKEFVKKYCPNHTDFNAVAMFVWSRSRETLKVKATVA